MAKKLIQTIQAPEGLCGQSVLAAGSLAIQGLADVEIDGRVYPLSTYAISIGETGERKTAIDRCALWPHRKHERALHEQYETHLLAYQNDADAYKKSREEALKKAKGREAKRLELNALGDPPMPPLLPILVMEEPTYEGLIKLLLSGQPSLGLFSDEGGRLIGGHGMNADNQLKTASGLCELWDGKRITRVRSGDGNAVLYGRRMSMHIMAQPAVAQIMICNSMLLEQGFLSRCLIVWPVTTAGTRIYQEINLTTDLDVSRYNERMLDILKTPPLVASGTRNELDPRNLSLTAEAKRLWVAFYNHVEEQLADDAPLSPIRGFANKAPEHATRIAGVLELVDNLHAPEITAASMEAGIVLVQFYIDEALRLVNASASDPNLILAEKLLAWVQTQKAEIIHLAQIYQLGPSPIRDAKTARKIADVLEDHGWLLRIDGGIEIDGSLRREAWRVQV
jgi:hypothetical protein